MTNVFNPMRAIAGLIVAAAAVSGCTAPTPAGYYGATAYQPTAYYNGFGETNEAFEGNEMGESHGGY
ncbi:MAG: hypothetical protein Q8Q26_02890 [Pseudorhodobacter sp.]|nr:hypothetical protein [Pseudorhodobacter sp.]